MKKINKNLVVKSNALVDSRDKMPQNCRYLLGYVISLVNPMSDKRFKEVKLTLQDIAELLDIKLDGLYKEVHLILKRLNQAVIGFREDDGSYNYFGWFYTCKFNPNDNTVLFKLHDKLNPFLLDLKTEYTQYRLITTKNFTSMYSTRVYEFAKRFEYKKDKKFTLSLDEIRQYFNCDNYKEWRDINRRVISPSLEDINTKSDIFLDIELIKTKRSVTHIKFNITNKRTAKDSDGDIPIEGQVHIDDTGITTVVNNNKTKDIRFACIRNINMKYIKELISQYGESTVIDAIKKFNESEEAKVTKRPLDYLRGIINNISKEKTPIAKTLNFTNYEQRSPELIEKQVEEIREQQFDDSDMTEVSKRVNANLEKIRAKG